MKICTRCFVEKDISCFQKRTASKDGLSFACRECLSLYDKSRANLPHRIEARAIYSKTGKGIESGNKAKIAYTKRNPIKRAAHIIVGNAIRDKKMFKEPCEICGTEEKVYAHHDDYAKPLNVRWLCPTHHGQWHKENGEAKNAA
jgi:hypothetical protein